MEQWVPRFGKPLQKREQVPFDGFPHFAAIHMLTKIGTSSPDLEAPPRKVLLRGSKSWVEVRDKLQPEGKPVGIASLQGRALVQVEGH